jgi:hypothetical protein
MGKLTLTVYWLRENHQMDVTDAHFSDDHLVDIYLTKKSSSGSRYCPMGKITFGLAQENRKFPLILINLFRWADKYIERGKLTREIVKER